MTRIEALKALFGSDPNKTASQEAIDAIGDDPRPTSDEEIELSSDTDVLDNAMDFAGKPESYANRLAPGPAKDLLLPYAGRLKATSGSSSDASATASTGSSTTSTKSVEATDPLADLGVGSSSLPADSGTGDIRPARGGKSKTATASDAAGDEGRGKGKKDRRDRRDESGTGDSAEPAAPAPPPKRPGSIVPIEWHEARKLTQWQPLREQLIVAARDTRSADNAVRGPAATRLEKLRGVVELYYGQGPQLRIMAIMARRLIEDLRDQLDLKDPDEFRARYDVF